MKIAETFVSLQGEGANSGLPTTFIRTAGCNLRCRWCDTAYAQEGGGEVSCESLRDWVRAMHPRRVCLTGGEPLLQPESVEFAIGLSGEGFEVEVETNGSLPIDGLLDSSVVVNMDYKLPSSGEEPRMRLENLALLRRSDQLKFVVSDAEDFSRAVAVIRTHMPSARLCMTPVGGLDLKWLAEEVLRSSLDIRVYPQLHKMIWGAKSGV